MTSDDVDEGEKEMSWLDRRWWKFMPVWLEGIITGTVIVAVMTATALWIERLLGGR